MTFPDSGHSTRSPDPVQLRRLLSSEDERPRILAPLATISNWVEDVVVAECRRIVQSEIGVALRAAPDQLLTPFGASAFTVGAERFHLIDEIRPSDEGMKLLFNLKRWPSSAAVVRPPIVFETAIEGVGRLSSVVIAAEEKVTSIDAAVTVRIRNVVEDWYRVLASYTERLMRQLVLEVVDEMLARIRIVVPFPHGETIWLYAIVADYGISLTDTLARRRALTSILTRRASVESSPLEAAMSIIAVEMERDKSFSDHVLKQDGPTDVIIPETVYARLIQDAEKLLYNSSTVIGMKLAASSNGDLGIVAAFPRNEAATNLIVPRLTKHLPEFQAMLDRFGGQLRGLVSRISLLARTDISEPPTVMNRGQLRIKLARRVSAFASYQRS